jgi:hypothetical protein
MTTETAFEDLQTDTEVKPRYCAVKLDETRNWLDSSIVDRAKRIYGVYLFDANLRVHCCEFTPSYECMFVESQFDNPNLPEREADWLSVEISEQDNYADPVRYFHCHEIEGLPQIEEGDLTQGIIDLDIDNEEEAFESGPTHHRFPNIPSACKISSRNSGSRAAVNCFFAMLSSAGWA